MIKAKFTFDISGNDSGVFFFFDTSVDCATTTTTKGC